MNYKVISNGNNPSPIRVYQNPKYELIKCNWVNLYKHKSTGVFLIDIPLTGQIITFSKEQAEIEFERGVRIGKKRW